MSSLYQDTFAAKDDESGRQADVKEGRLPEGISPRSSPGLSAKQSSLQCIGAYVSIYIYIYVCMYIYIHFHWADFRTPPTS